MNARSLCVGYDGSHQADIVTIENGIERQIGLDMAFATDPADFFKIFQCKIDRGSRSHIELFHTEINGMSTCMDGRNYSYEPAGAISSTSGKA